MTSTNYPFNRKYHFNVASNDQDSDTTVVCHGKVATIFTSDPILYAIAYEVVRQSGMAFIPVSLLVNEARLATYQQECAKRGLVIAPFYAALTDLIDIAKTVNTVQAVELLTIAPRTHEVFRDALGLLAELSNVEALKWPGVLATEDEMQRSQERQALQQRLKKNRKKEPFVKVEYDEGYFGGNYTSVGDFGYVPLRWLTAACNNNKD